MSNVKSVHAQLTDKTEDPYEIDKCVKWIETHNLEKVCIFSFLCLISSMK